MNTARCECMSHRAGAAALTGMTTFRYVTWLLLGLFLALAACDKSSVVLHNTVDSGNNKDGHNAGSDGSGDGVCSVAPWEFPTSNLEPPWVTNSCPSGGCPGTTACVHAAIAGGIVELGCAPVPGACEGAPSCGCMGCVCGSGAPCGEDGQNLLVCETPTLSTRKAKTDIAYVDADERAALARDALAIPLARYRYKTEAPGARRRLGFIIEDQPDPSPAVLSDRNHVDEYGYASMLLATVQEQAKQIAELRARVDRLERTQDHTFASSSAVRPSYSASTAMPALAVMP
jgi:hypothetical protein